MTEVNYKDHAIISFARFDEGSRCWVPMVEISWRTGNLQESHTISGPLKGFEKWQEAETFMTEMAKAWIDHHPWQAFGLQSDSNNALPLRRG